MDTENPCEKCREQSFCQGQFPCKRKDAYIEYTEECEKISERIKEVMARAKNE